MKDVIKTRASLVLDVLRLEWNKTSRKVLHLLVNILSAYPVLHKEFISRFDITNSLFMRGLCTEYNYLCRRPFIEMVTCLLRRADVDVLKYFATGSGRFIVSHCFEVIHKKLKAEIDYDDIDVVKKQFKVMPSRVQQSELLTLTCFIDTIAAVLVSPSSSDHVKNQGTMNYLRLTMFSDLYILKPLVSIVLADDPPLSTVPRLVTSFNVTLRQSAKSLLDRILSMRIKIPLASIAGFFAKSKPYASTKLFDFIITFVKDHPQIGPYLLEFPFALCGGNPRLTSAWLAGTAILSECHSTNISVPNGAVLEICIVYLPVPQGSTIRQKYRVTGIIDDFHESW